jgi:hypothetical protein
MRRIWCYDSSPEDALTHWFRPDQRSLARVLARIAGIGSTAPSPACLENRYSSFGGSGVRISPPPLYPPEVSRLPADRYFYGLLARHRPAARSGGAEPGLARREPGTGQWRELSFPGQRRGVRAGLRSATGNRVLAERRVAGSNPALSAISPPEVRLRWEACRLPAACSRTESPRLRRFDPPAPRRVAVQPRLYAEPVMGDSGQRPVLNPTRRLPCAQRFSLAGRARWNSDSSPAGLERARESKEEAPVARASRTRP